MADYREAGQGLPTNAGPSVPVDMREYVPMTYAGAGRGWVPLTPEPTVERVAPGQAPRPQTEVYSDANIPDPFMPGEITPAKEVEWAWWTQITENVFPEGEQEDWGFPDPALEHVRSQLEEVAAEEYEHAGDVLPRQDGHVKGALGPVETALNRVKTGLATSFGELPSGGVRRLRDAIGTHSSTSIVRPTGDIVDTSRPKVAAREMGRIQSLRREVIARVSGKAVQEPTDHNVDVWGVESLGPDVEEDAAQLTPEEFQHLAIEDQEERMWDEREAVPDGWGDRNLYDGADPGFLVYGMDPVTYASGLLFDLEFREDAVLDIAEAVPSLSVPSSVRERIPEKARIAQSRIAESRDQDPDRSIGRGEWIRVQRPWGIEKVFISDTEKPDLKAWQHVKLSRGQTLGPKHQRGVRSNGLHRPATEGNLTEEELRHAPPAEIVAERNGILIEKVDGHLDVYDAKGARVSAEVLAEAELKEGEEVVIEAFESALTAEDRRDL